MSIIWGRLNRTNKPFKPTALKKLKETFSHVLPESTYSWHDLKCQMACCHKWNSPESTNEKIPLSDPKGQFTITADCRIDNRPELLMALEISDHTVGDSYLILHAYRKWGRDCVKHLIGAFAFAIYDNQNKEIFCARDQMGVRPLFYTLNDRLFAFCTEKKGLLLIEDFDDALNEDYLINYIGWFQQEVTATSHKHIHRLLPAHTMTINSDRIEQLKYWDLDASKEIYYKNDEDYVAAFRKKMFDAVKCRLRSHEEIGVELSGGLDSSGIAVIAQKLLTKRNSNLHSFELLLPEEHRGKTWPFNDNKIYIDEICEKAEIVNRHQITSLGGHSYKNILDLRLKIYDGIAEFNIFHLGVMKEKAQKLGNIGVMLSGFNGDELVSSYAINAPLEQLEHNRWLTYFRLGRLNADKSIGEISVKHLIHSFFYYYAHKIHPELARSGYDLVKRQKHKRREKIFSETGNFLSSDLYNKYKRPFARSRRGTYPPNSFKEDQKQGILWPVSHYRMEAENLTGNFFGGIETRYPMADIRLLEYVLALPAEQKRSPEYSRYLYRRGLSGLLPDSVTWRKEEGPGGTSPFAYVDFQRYLPETLAFLDEINSAKDEYFPYLNIDKMIEQYQYSIDMQLGNKPRKFTANNRIGSLILLARYMLKLKKISYL